MKKRHPQQHEAGALWQAGVVEGFVHRVNSPWEGAESLRKPHETAFKSKVTLNVYEC